MQQTKSYWYLLAAFGVASAFVGAACTVNSSTVIDDGSAGDDNTAGTTNAGAAGAGEGGASAGTGGTAGTAGTAGATGGTAGVDPTTVPACDSGDTPTGTPAGSCDSGAAADACSTCVIAHCCTEFSECYGTSPGNVCGFGGPNNNGEFFCYQTCLQKVNTDNGSISEDDRATCAANCTTSTDAMGALDCGTLGTSTNSLITCLMDNDCNTACYGG